ncbi:hypothetical protein, partial [Vibrio sp. 10N.261.51.C6]|uniref:hypothetical protein n=1 Tax=Vibrio sp. 10N.261.51.C6 TaxID=3229676 RepID=UPI0035533ED8
SISSKKDIFLAPDKINNNLIGINITTIFIYLLKNIQKDNLLTSTKASFLKNGYNERNTEKNATFLAKAVFILLKNFIA